MAAPSLKVPARHSGGTGYVPGHWRADAPSGTPLPEEGGRTPPPPPVNSSTGGRHEPSYDRTEERLREITAKNIAEHKAALAPRRWTPPGERA